MSSLERAAGGGRRKRVSEPAGGGAALLLLLLRSQPPPPPSSAPPSPSPPAVLSGSRLPPSFPLPSSFPLSPSSVFADPALSLALFLSFSLSPDSCGFLLLWSTLCQHLFSPPSPTFLLLLVSPVSLFSLSALCLCYFLLLRSFAAPHSLFSSLPPLSLGWVRTGCAPPASSCSEQGRGEPLGSKGTKGAPSPAGHHLRTMRTCQGWRLGPTRGSEKHLEGQSPSMSGPRHAKLGRTWEDG